MEAGSGEAQSEVDRQPAAAVIEERPSPCDPWRTFRDPNVRLAGRGGRTARGHRHGWHGAVAGPAGIGDGSFGGHRRGCGPGSGPAGTEGSGLCPHRGQHRDVTYPARRTSSPCSRPSALSTVVWTSASTMLAWPGLTPCSQAVPAAGRTCSIMYGHQVSPHSVIHFYSATKYAVTALTEGLRQELREAQTHIRATCISPEVVETQFAFKLHDKDPGKAAATYERIKCLKPEDVAEAVLYVLSTPPHVQIGDIQMRPTEQVI
ncbi:dehydrogenase/reductase SDR family member 11 isoform X7 [Lutra lutra]|uniref:dehydrogenase/reductase SDR family member 11 isoform X7 n=1 Tax=Lutra lutra TaxID=9657 RepID=UPI001FD35271|nr:dehydrogenase/reductase SDR family member 11 isoform X7 [Lutra lutra]